MSSRPTEVLAELLRVERVGDLEFGAVLESFWGASLRGDLLARAALAASATASGRELRSLHASFLRPAPPSVPLRLRVAVIDDGPEHALREVGVSGDAPLCRVVLRFGSAGAASGGPSYQDVAPDSALAAPDTLPSTRETAEVEGWGDYAAGPLEFRRIGPLWPRESKGESRVHRAWLRPRAPLPDDPRVHVAALVFASEFYGHWGFERRVGPRFAPERLVALDHALWIHRAPRWDDWWLLEATSDVSVGGRALGRRAIYARKGELLASAAHEARIEEREVP